ncbi:MAG: hypothetical protein PPP58_08290 [Natronomonas sp.]
MSPDTVTIEVTRREKRDVVRALQAFAERTEEEGSPGEADRLRGLASRIERE